MTLRQILCALAAVVLLLVALLMPTGWYDALPRDTNFPLPPITGVLLLRIFLTVQAGLFAIVAWTDSRYVQLSPTSLPHIGGDRTEDGDLEQTRALWWLAAITAGALALRLYHVSSDLWIDEIAAYYNNSKLSMLEVVGTYISSNNHLLNTLLLKAMVNAFGAHEWSMRLPAILFGVASVPMLYWCARLVLSRRGALGSALLLAVSYHHVFFSQNARGYSAYLFFALLGTRALVDALREDRGRSWLLFVFATVLGFASLLNTVFVLAAQGLVAVIAIAIVVRRGDNARPLFIRTFTMFGSATFLSAELYAVAMPTAYVVMTHVYYVKSTGFAPTSNEFLKELVRGLTAGFGTGTAFAVIAAVVFLSIAAAGFLALWRRSWLVAVSLAGPGVLTALFLFVKGMTFSPRYFLLWLPLTAITAVVAIDEGCAFVFRREPSWQLARRRVATGAVATLSLLSLLSLKRYYEIPKQPFRAAVHYVEARRAPADMVVVIEHAKIGVMYYGGEVGAPIARNYRFVNSSKQLDSAITTTPHAKVWLVTTLERSLRIDYPDLPARLNAQYERRVNFPATIGDGDISVWAQR